MRRALVFGRVVRAMGCRVEKVYRTPYYAILAADSSRVFGFRTDLELHVPGRAADSPVNVGVVTPKERPEDQSAAPQPAVKKDELTAQTGLGRIAEATAKGDYTAAATEYALTIVTEIPNVAVGMFLYGAAKNAITAGHKGGAGAALASAGKSYASYVGGLIPVVPAIIGAYESGQRASDATGAAKVGAGIDTYFNTIQAITQAVGILGVPKIGEATGEESGGWLNRLLENETGSAGDPRLNPKRVGRLLAQLQGGNDVTVGSVEEARAILDRSGLKPFTSENFTPGTPAPRGTYRGDLLNTRDPTAPYVHPAGSAPPAHAENPHYNLYFPNGRKAAIIIVGRR